ncbi:TIM-barrel domain-containing protein [Cellulomonas endometrii]|uniref:glycoside hydrolase family 31 protein n=1 Tax=Cellulomonas endometrii TaxID=3036301 RepID=UPI0024AE4B04|nr:TIM-barrel domain-containing protein [Cellulomonas endometrii]
MPQPLPASDAADLAVADPAAVVAGPGFRITVLTSRLLRIERSVVGAFEDRPTQLVRRRRFDAPEVTVREDEGGLDLWTEHLHLRYDRGDLTPSGLTVDLRQRAQASHHTQWRYGDDPWGRGGHRSNLGGTARTLDDVDGRPEIEPGLLSRDGFALVDDSGSLALVDDWPVPRAGEAQDLYLFGYGRDHQAALRDFFRLTGPSPLLPRWALGTWWSRFHRYDEREYLDLMDRFADAGVPLSVAVVDMDWHLVDIDPALGSGWTGYTWNTDLFPDPPRFLAELHRRGLHVSLNTHPADGVRRHEAAYPDVARDLGLDPEEGLPVAFDITDPRFVDTYLRRLHHPHEDAGVDLWWLDWQSGEASRVAGLDPLWMLNHVHYRDSGRDGRRPLTFSRYAGLGSHRQPVGFSGDTYATWASLAAQPEFTATAANVGYFWWSHDIGGHYPVQHDPELMVRWYQLGAFSPVNRLHSASNPFVAKEPWRYDDDTAAAMTRYLRLRHALVPYLYTAMWRAHTDGVGPVRPMYHDHPQDAGAYEVPSTFLFGPDLVVAPVTAPVDATGLAAVETWLPDGDWHDLFTGRRYRGGRRVRLHRGVAEMPVLARAGAVLPLAGDPGDAVDDAPRELTLRVFPGPAGEATLVEDDGSAAPVPHVTRFALDALGPEGDVVLTVEPGRGARTDRHLRLEVVGLVPGPEVQVHGAPGGRAGVVALGSDGGAPADGDAVGAGVDLGPVDLTAGLRVVVSGLVPPAPDLPADVVRLLAPLRMSIGLKTQALEAARGAGGAGLAQRWHALGLPDTVLGALLELLG